MRTKITRQQYEELLAREGKLKDEVEEAFRSSGSNRNLSTDDPDAGSIQCMNDALVFQQQLCSVQSLLAAAEVVDGFKKTNDGEVEVGDKIVIEEDGEEKTVTILGVNGGKGTISSDSPLARAILGRAVGQKVTVDCPEPYKVKILAIK